MKEKLKFIGKALQLIALGITLGSILTIGPIVAPSVFYNIERMTAIGLMNIIFLKVTIFLLALLLAFLLGSVLRVASATDPKRAKKSLVTLVLSLIFVSVSLYNLCNVTPQIATWVKEGHTKEDAQFNALHNTSRGLFMGEAGLSLILILLLI